MFLIMIISKEIKLYIFLKKILKLCEMLNCKTFQPIKLHQFHLPKTSKQKPKKKERNALVKCFFKNKHKNKKELTSKKLLGRYRPTKEENRNVSNVL